jgi:regulator of replication initiation timing
MRDGEMDLRDYKIAKLKSQVAELMDKNCELEFEVLALRQEIEKNDNTENNNQ